MWSGFFANQKNVFTFAVLKNDGKSFSDREKNLTLMVFYSRVTYKITRS